MPPFSLEEKASRFCKLAEAKNRLGMSEFARGRTWRPVLQEAGCVEVTDRSDTVGVLMAPDYAKGLSAYIRQLEDELEQAHMEALFELRRDYSAPASGADLAQAASAHLAAHSSEIREFLDGDS